MLPGKGDSRHFLVVLHPCETVGWWVPREDKEGAGDLE